MDETGRLIEHHAPSVVRKQEYMAHVRAFIAAEGAGDATATRAALEDLHIAAVGYFNVFEQTAGYTQSVPTTPSWRRNLAEECVTVLDTRIKYEQMLNRVAKNYGFDLTPLQPSRRAYAAMQRLVRQELADDAIELRSRFVDAGLPVSGFDDASAAVQRGRPSVNELRGTVDFAIITIKEEEFTAVLAQLPPEPDRAVTMARGYVLREVPQVDGRPAVVAITRMTDTQGNGVSQDMFYDVVGDLDPQWVLCVGIAGGAPASEFSLGDVLLGSSVIDTSVEAIKIGKEPEYAVVTIPAHIDVDNYCSIMKGTASTLGDWATLWDAPFRPDRKRLDAPAIALKTKNFYGEKDWVKRTRDSLRADEKTRPRRPRVSTGMIAASDRLVKHDKVMAAWMKVARQIRAVEMESAGVYRAALGRGEHRKAYPAMTIRGISDIVGFKRDEAWTQYACVSAASFAHAFIRSGHVTARRQPPIAPSRTVRREPERQPEPAFRWAPSALGCVLHTHRPQARALLGPAPTIPHRTIDVYPFSAPDAMLAREALSATIEQMAVSLGGEVFPIHFDEGVVRKPFLEGRTWDRLANVSYRLAVGFDGSFALRQALWEDHVGGHLWPANRRGTLLGGSYIAELAIKAMMYAKQLWAMYRVKPEHGRLRVSISHAGLKNRHLFAETKDLRDATPGYLACEIDRHEVSATIVPDLTTDEIIAVTARMLEDIAHAFDASSLVPTIMQRARDRLRL